MANASIKAAFERMWQHITNALSTKVSFTEEQILTDEQKQQAQDNIGFSEVEAISFAVSMGLVSPATNEDGLAYTNENGLIYSL